MKKFNYRGLSPDGAQTTGLISAADERSAIVELSTRNVAVTRINEATSLKAFSKKRASSKDRIRFFRQFSILAKSGVPLLEAIASIVDGEPCREIAYKGQKIKSKLRSGGKLSYAILSCMPEVPKYAVRFLELGEATGTIPARLADIAEQMERDAAVKNEIKNSLTYPIFLSCAGLVAIFFIFTFVVPRFSALVIDNNVTLPLISEIVIGIGLFVSTNLFAVLAGLLLLAGLITLLLSARDFRNRLASFAYYIPILSTFLSAADKARWSRVAAIALRAGAPVMEALSLAEQNIGYPARRRDYQEARRAIRSGELIEHAFKSHTDLDFLSINLLKTGREAGNLEEILFYIASNSDENLKNTSKRLSSMAEPLAIGVVASVIGVVVIALVLAMSSLYDVQI